MHGLARPSRPRGPSGGNVGLSGMLSAAIWVFWCLSVADKVETQRLRYEVLIVRTKGHLVT